MRCAASTDSPKFVSILEGRVPDPLFTASGRVLSSGCIQQHSPAQTLRWIFQDEPGSERPSKRSSRRNLLTSRAGLDRGPEAGFPSKRGVVYRSKPLATSSRDPCI